MMIFYVKDQKKSRDFYQKIFLEDPELDVPGMSAFKISDALSLGLMPETGIKKILGDKLPDPCKSNGLSRVELYLSVNNPAELHQRALEAGAIELSPLEPRNWGEKVAYSIDPDGHVLAFGGPL
ncbi:MAG: glyoxalase [Bacteriovoracaceae bacterium]|nr:glyoxalase [Bacteriovoracaceae bacterium]